ncbi:MAG TPA: hypothetical protein VMK83_11405 [Gaiellaceae bacterium]|nr:hypothetical protein [Gaiellaceae bacterium]
MRTRRGVILAALLVLLVAYGAGARHLPGLPSGLDVAFYTLVVLPAFAATIWLALPLARGGTKALLALTAIAAALAVVLTLLDVGSAANVAKLACYSLAGFTFLSLFEELWWLTLVAVLVPWVDIWSVAAGPTEYIVEERPGLFENVAVAFPAPGESAVVNIGPPDILFFALFLAAAHRFRLRVAATWVGLTACLGATLALVWYWDDVAGLPALPAVCLGFLLPNADLLWRDVRAALASRREAPEPK